MQTHDEEVERILGELRRQDWLEGTEAPILRKSRFEISFPPHVRALPAQVWKTVIVVFFGLTAAHETSGSYFLAKVVDILHQIASRDIRTEILTCAGILGMEPLTVYVLLALQVKHLALQADPPLLRQDGLKLLRFEA